VSDDVSAGGEAAPSPTGAVPDPAPAEAQPTAAVRALQERWADSIELVEVNDGQWRIELSEREPLVDMVRHLKETPELGFDFLVDVTGLDHYGEEPRFRAVYILRSMQLREELVLKVKVPETGDPEGIWAPSLTSLYPTADWLEREAYDMFGLEFRGHPDLRRIMMPEIFHDHPLRKDFPMEGKMTDHEWAEWIIERSQRLTEQG